MGLRRCDVYALPCCTIRSGLQFDRPPFIQSWRHVSVSDLDAPEMYHNTPLPPDQDLLFVWFPQVPDLDLTSTPHT